MDKLTDIFESFRDNDNVCFIYRTEIRRFVVKYGEFYEQCLKLAGYLKDNGISKGDRVCIWAPNSPYWARVYWALVQIGAIVVPIDFISDRKRAETIIKSSNPKMIFQSVYKTERYSQDELDEMVDNCMCVDIEDVDKITAQTDVYKNQEDISSEDIVEIVYTSGTTGNPKGVVLKHKNLVANIKQIKNHIHVDKGFVFLSVLPLSHMFEQTGGFLIPLSCGGRIVYLQTLKPSAIVSAFKDEDIWTVMMVPRLLQALADSIRRKFDRPVLKNIFYGLMKLSKKISFEKRKKLFSFIHRKFGKNLKYFISGGASLDRNTAEFWNFLGFKIIEGYGLSETSPVLTANPESRIKIKSAGVPLEDINIRIEKDGEIVVSGPNVFDGYWENDTATKESFTEDGYFKTGDIGYFDDDGYLYIKGRKKEMIVLPSGINVYPDDIEAVAVKDERVKECCVVGINSDGGEQVHAVFVIDDKYKDHISDIVKKINKSLSPAEQIISYSVYDKPELPKTPTLKVRRFLVKREIESKSSEKSSTGEDKLYRIVASALKISVDSISEDSSLYTDLHMSSIDRITLVNILEQEYRVDIDEDSINQNTRISDIRMIVEKKKKYFSRTKFRYWTNSSLLRLMRKNIFFRFHNFVLSFFVRLKVTGVEKLKNIDQPVIFISNHLSYIDFGVIVKSMPNSLSVNMSTAAREEFFFPNSNRKWVNLLARLAYEYSTIVSNVFMLPQRRGFRKSLQYMGKLADGGINILIFPEGERSRTGQLLPFMPGIGLIVKELKIPVVPIKIKGLEKVFPRGAKWPKKGDVEVVYGDMMDVSGCSQEEIVRICEEKIKSL